MKVAITGATGNQGQRVVWHALQAGHQVTAIVRKLDDDRARKLRDWGARLCLGDLDSPEGLAEGFKGQEGVFSVQNFWRGGNVAEFVQARSIVQAAQAAGVSRFVQSTMAIDVTSRSANAQVKAIIERLAREVFPDALILRPVWFMEGYNPTSFNAAARQFEFVTDPAKKHAWVSLDDIGRVVARAFSQFGDYAGQTFTLASGAHTGPEMAQAFGKAFGVPISYRQLSREEISAKTVSWFATQPVYLHEIDAIFDFIRDVGFTVDWDLHARLAPKRHSLDSWVSDIALPAWRDQLLPALGVNG